jgi:hypothetical protein
MTGAIIGTRLSVALVIARLAVGIVFVNDSIGELDKLDNGLSRDLFRSSICFSAQQKTSPDGRNAPGP